MLEIKNMEQSDHYHYINDYLRFEDEIFLYLVKHKYGEDSIEYIASRSTEDSRVFDEKFSNRLLGFLYNNVYKCIGLLDRDTGHLEGYLLYKEEDELYEDRKNIYISSMCIDKKYRGKGFGKQMIEFLKTEIRKYQSDIYISLNVFNCNKNSCKFYTSVGFSDRYPDSSIYEFYEENTI